jgi:hypothetical protein
MILIKTEAGHQVLKDRSLRLTPRQRSAFILFDGKRSVNDVIEAGVGIAREDIDQLVQLGLLGHANGSAAAASSSVAPAPLQSEARASPGSTRISAEPAPAVAASQSVLRRSSQQRYKDAYPIATQLTGSLGLRGFRLNLSVEGTSTYEELLDLLPKIRAAVGPEKAAALERALIDD